MLTAASPLRFGPEGRFLLEPAERRLRVDGEPIALGARALDLLVVLSAEPGHLLTKDELLDRVWPGLVVGEANLQVQISNLRKVLGGDTIATVPGRGYRFAAEVQVQVQVPAPAAPVPAAPPAAAAVAAPAPSPSPLPQAAGPRLVGRTDELAQLQQWLQAPGCVTLVGTSGVGKTSLARALVAGWPGRGLWVDLAALEQGAQLVPALARALARPLPEGDPLPTLRRALAGEERLLVLDNAEHVVQDCAELVGALQDLPDLRWLVTSQLPLALPGERVLRLQPLALDPGAQARPDHLGDGALALLVERIRAADHRFNPTPAQLPVLAEICARLDGLPLAIEMAAARVPLLGVQAVHDALAERFALLTRGHRSAAPRHRTLHQALEWSYKLLSGDEQRLLRRLAVFAGGFTLDLAVALATPDGEGVAGLRWELIDRLAALVDRSLVVAGPEEPPRYHLLETVRAFGLEQLAESGELPSARRRHAQVLRALFATVPGGSSPLHLAEMENARAAWSWGCAEDLALAVEIANGAALAATFTAWRQECTHWLHALEPAMNAEAGAQLPLALRVAWWVQHARALVLRSGAGSAAAARRATALARELGDPRQTLNAASVWVRSQQQAGPELDEAVAALQAAAEGVHDLQPRERLSLQGALSRAALIRQDIEAALDGRLAEARLAREAHWPAAEDAAESNVVNMLNALQRHDEARRLGQALLARVDERGGATEGNLPWVLNGLITACILSGRIEEAVDLLPRAQAARRRFGTPVLAPALVQLALARQQHEAAARLIGHVRASYAAQDMQVDPVDEANLMLAARAAAAVLGDTLADALVAEGRRLGDADAATLAGGRPVD